MDFVQTFRHIFSLITEMLSKFIPKIEWNSHNLDQIISVTYLSNMTRHLIFIQLNPLKVILMSV